ncbi:adhesion G protein-coupled receptor E5 [Corythoichthys intestinalis]|uniref:adhesion G protein-coupled receptor E5 n=1 Tax=Corythoichthys intestinalis TaxID=161448 RepID=UPI0025A4EEBE|nr:adhesion G protein-coupled receptor E5 [Corythoichthys intestinalis]
MGGAKNFQLFLGLMCTVKICMAACDSGKEMNLTEGICTDVNECGENPGPCGNHTECFNTNGSYYCRCEHGFINIYGKDNFTGVDGQCKDKNECGIDKDICGDRAVCINMQGSYRCDCKSGYTKTSTNGGCSDINECDEAKIRKEDICGPKGSCKNTNGSYSCICEKGYTNYGNEKTLCSELNCETFDARSGNSEYNSGLADLLSIMRNSCMALANPDHGNESKADGDALLERFLTASEPVLSWADKDIREDVYELLSTMENSIKLIGPQLRGNNTIMGSNQTTVKIAVRRQRSPPTGPLHLGTENSTLDTDWSTAAGTAGAYPGFAMAALLNYHNLERSVNRSFEELQGFEKDGAEPAFKIFSRVVSVVVSNPSTQNLSHQVILTLRHLEDKSEARFICAYWNERGAWATDGCHQQKSNATHTVCRCEHLSSFAVLMAHYAVDQSFAIQLITKIGLILSLLCLSVCILTFKFCRSIQGTRTTIHLHLCICLFIADLIFLAGISQTKPEGGCRFIAAMLHLFFMGVFAWMLLEGVQLYRMVVLVFNATIRPLYLFLFGYGTPLVVVILTAIIRPKGYGTKEHCWLSLKDGLIWSFYGPVCVIIFLNVFFFIVTVWKLAQKFSSLNPDLSKLNKLKAFTVTAIAQMCILGLMWVFGAFLFREGNIVVEYIFTILNSLQGALVFIMHCLLSKQVRDEYHNFFSCICAPKKRYSDFSSTNPSNSHSHGSRSGQNTGESNI